MRLAGSLTDYSRLSILAGRVGLAACLVAVIFNAYAAGQQLPATIPVDGIVKNSLTLQPVARALVESGPDAVLTDSQGRFELHLPGGAADLTVRRPGYEGQRNGRPRPQVRVNVSANTQPVTILLTPAASITGHVTLSSGDQAAGLRFSLRSKQIEEGHPRWATIGSAVTDNDGTFRLPVLAAPGSYVLCTHAWLDWSGPSRLGARNKVVMGYPGACYPGGFDLKSAIAAPLSLSPGQQAQLEISVSLQPFYPVSIAVAGNEGRRPPSPMVFDRSGQPANTGTRFNSQTGAFDVNLPNGSYYAQTRAGGNPPLYARVDFTVAGAPVSGLSLVPAPVVPIQIEVREDFTDNSTSASGAPGVIRQMGDLTGDQAPVQIMFDAVDPTLNGRIGGNMRREPGSTDTFLMDPPQQGSYLVNVQGFEPHVYAASVTSGGVDLLRDPLVLGAGGSVQPIQITLRNDMGFLDCTPRADAGSTENQSAIGPTLIPVIAIPIGAASRRIYPSFARTAVIQAPAYPLPPGKYLVLAFENQSEIDLDDAEAMSRLAARGQTVTIQPGATVNLQVDPIRDGDEEAAR